MKGGLLLVAICCAMAVSARAAEVITTKVPTDHGVQLFRWPKLTPPPGWHQDMAQSGAQGVNALAPDGSTFDKADTVIYAKAIYIPGQSRVRDLKQLINEDRDAFRKSDPAVGISQLDTLESRAGLDFQIYSFASPAQPDWEAVAYGEDQDYFFLFVLSSRTEAGFRANLSTFQDLVRSY